MPTVITGTDGVSQVQTGAVEKGDLFSGFANGITEVDQWYLTAELTAPSGTISTNLSRFTLGEVDNFGTGMTESSGVFTFPSTGYWLVQCEMQARNNSSGVNDRLNIKIESTQNNSTYTSITEIGGSVDGTVNGGQEKGFGQCVLNVTDTSNVKVRFVAASFDASSKLQGATNLKLTGFTFIRLGDN